MTLTGYKNCDKCGLLLRIETHFKGLLGGARHGTFDVRDLYHDTCRACEAGVSRFSGVEVIQDAPVKETA
jgi:hypothetical protein